MKEIRKAWKSLQEDFTTSELFDALLGAFILATILFIPIMLVFIELVSIYLYRLTFWSFMIIIALFGYMTFIHFLWHKSLKLKNPDHKTDIIKLFIKNTIIINAIILILGILVIFVLIPILFV